MKDPFTDEQIVSILQEAEKGEKPITDICREHNIGEAPCYRWKRRFGGMEVRRNGSGSIGKIGMGRFHPPRLLEIPFQE
ncbi:MAG: transposase [Armatimonadetes bacterium]|nr:transposase [Armatimonadota bacterium]